MHLGGKRIRGASIKTWLSEEAVPPLDNPLDVLKQGDIDTVVRSLIPFVIFKVAQYKALTNYDTDELISEGMLGLMEGLRDLSEMTNFMLHVSVHIERRLSRCTTRCYRRNEVLRSDFTIETVDQTMTAYDLKELYTACVQDTVEGKVLTCLLEGYNQVEIAKMLGENKTTISRIKQRLFNRIKDAVP